MNEPRRDAASWQEQERLYERPNLGWPYGDVLKAIRYLKALSDGHYYWHELEKKSGFSRWELLEAKWFLTNEISPWRDQYFLSRVFFVSHTEAEWEEHVRVYGRWDHNE